VKKTEKKIVPFRYPGGKFYALGLIKPYILACEHDEYREPFVGGGSVFFNKDKSQFNILNDIDEELIITYRVMQDPQKRDALLKLISNEIATKERWREVFEFIPTNEIEVAFKYYYLNRTSFSGKLSSPAWGYREKRSLPPERWHEKLIPCGQMLDGVDLLCRDFKEIIEQEPRGNSVLMFVDPPYFKPSKKKHYRHGFELADHLRLLECLKDTKHKFILTYEDVPEVRELYSWANIHDVSFSYRVDNSAINQGARKTGTELIITNY
jgi:DNA adenine methylase